MRWGVFTCLQALNGPQHATRVGRFYSPIAENAFYTCWVADALGPLPKIDMRIVSFLFLFFFDCIIISCRSIGIDHYKITLGGTCLLRIDIWAYRNNQGGKVE